MDNTTKLNVALGGVAVALAIGGAVVLNHDWPVPVAAPADATPAAIRRTTDIGGELVGPGADDVTTVQLPEGARGPFNVAPTGEAVGAFYVVSAEQKSRYVEVRVKNHADHAIRFTADLSYEAGR